MTDPWEDDLLRHQRFLLRLASRLAGPEVEAEDLVQDAFARALERPPRARADGSLRAWLATVLRRGAARSARGARRRDAREERVARPEAREEHAQVDARLDAHAELLALLRDLPEGERLALFLRYSEDLAPPAIAARLELPLETVRTRLRRGRERLRAQLDASHGDRAAWCALLLPASTPLHPTIAPASAVPVSTSAATAAIRIGAGVLVSTTAKILVGVAATSAALFLWIDRRGASEHRVASSEPARVEVELASAPESELRGDAGPTERDAIPAGASSVADLGAAEHVDVTTDLPGSPPHAAWPLIVRAEGTPAQGAAIRVSARLDAFGRYDAPAIKDVIGANNELVLDVGAHLADLLANAEGARAEELIVKLDHPDLVPAEASLVLPDPLDPTQPPDEPLVAIVRVQRASIVVGRVVDDAHEPLGRETWVQAHALRGGEIDRGARGSIEPSDDGSFRLRVEGDGPFALLALARGLRPGTALPVLARGGVVDVGDVVVSRGLTIDGRAVDLAGRPNRGANVFAMLLGERTLVDLARWSFDLPGTVAWIDGAFELFVGDVKTRDDGSFRVEGLGPRRYQLDTLPPKIEVPFALDEKPIVTAPATIELRPHAAELRLSVRFPGGPPRDGTALWTRGDTEKRVGLDAWGYRTSLEDFAADVGGDFVDGEFEVSMDSVNTFESSEGAPSFGSSQDPGAPYLRRFALPPNESFRLELRVEGCAPVELAFHTPGPGGLVERAVTLEPETALANLVLVLRGVPVEDGTPFVALLRGAAGERDPTLRSKDGELALDGLPAGELSLVLSAGEDRFAPQAHLRDVELSLVLQPGETRRVDVALERGGTLIIEALDETGARLDAKCTVRDAAGNALDVVFVARIPDGRIAGHNRLFSGGPSRGVPELAPGPYRVEIRAADRKEIVDVVIEAGATTERSITLRPR